MKQSNLWKRVLSCVLLLSMLIGLLPVQSLAAEEGTSETAAATDFAALYEALTAPANRIVDLSVMNGVGITPLAEGTYYIVNHSISEGEGLLLDLSVRYDETDYYHATPVTVQNESVIGGDPDKAIRLRPGYVGERLEPWRVQLWPVVGVRGGGETLSGITEYSGLYASAAGNPGVGLRNEDLVIHYYMQIPNDATWYWYSITYVEEIGGFRPVLNKETTGSIYNRFKLYRLAFHVSELYKAIMRMKDYADGNPNGRYDATVYEDFCKELLDCIDTYNAENKLLDTDAAQESKKPVLDEKAEALLSYIGKLTSVDATANYIDIPAEFLDFRADGLFFEYDTINKEYNLQSHGDKVYAPLGVGGNVFKNLTEPILLDRKLVYNQGTVSYVANLIHNQKRYSLGTLSDGWNTAFYNRLNEQLPLGDWDKTLEKTTGKKLPNGNGGDLLYEQVETAFDLAYYILNYAWRESDSADALDPAVGLSYNTLVEERDRIRLQSDPDKDGYYTLDAAKEVVYDGYYIYNALPIIDTNTPFHGCKFRPLDNLGFEHSDVLKKLNAKDTDRSEWYANLRGNAINGTNFHYTMHAYGSFVYYEDQDLYFEFIGDDDVYFFINGEMALDLGGTHYAVGDGIYLNNFRFADGSKLQEGQVYDFDMFYAERHTTESNMRFSTNIKIVDTETLTTKGQYLERSGSESFVNNNSGMGKEMIDNAAVKVGDTIAYSFQILNRREVPVVDLSFRDDSLGTVLSADSIKLYDQAKTNGAKTLITDLRLFYRSYDPETDLTHSGEPVMLSYTELQELLKAPFEKPDGIIVKEYASLPEGSYGIQIQTDDQLISLLTMGIPRNCSFSIYGFKRKTVEGDSPYKNTMSSQCYYSRLVTNEGVEEEKILITGAASRVLQVTASLPDAVPQKFVLDYGKALEIPLDYLRSSIRTDSLVQVDTLVGFSRTGRNAEHLKNLPKDVICTKVGDREALGQGTLTRGDTAVVYQLTDFMDQIERVYAIYSLKGCNTIDQNGNVTEYKYITVEILLIPATMVYYESDFAVGAISVDDPCNTLFFDFKNTEEDRLRYQNAVYGGYNFDLEGKGFWASHATEAGKAANYTNWYIDNDAGTLTVYVGDDLEGEKNACGPKIMTTNTYTVFPWTGRGAYAPLKFNPKGAEVLEVRFRVDGCIQDGYLTTPAVEMEYHLNDAQGTDQIKYGHSRTEFTFTQGQYITKTLTLSSAFKDAKEITSLGLRFVGIKSPSNDNKGTVTIDYIYVGPKKQAAAEPKIFIDFTNDEAAQLRYTQTAYNGYNFDRAENPNWSVGGTSGGDKGLTINNADGSLTIHKVKATPDENDLYGPYLSVSKDYGIYPWSKYPDRGPWNFALNGEDLIRIRFKTDGCQTVVGEPVVQLLSHYTNSAGTAVYKAGIASKAYTHEDGKYTTVDIPMPSALLTAKSIQSLGFRFLDLKSDGTGSLTVDYILVCKETEADSILAQKRSGWSIATDASPSDAYQDLDMNTATATQSGNAILRQLHSDTQVQPEYYGAQNATEKLTNGSPLSFTHRGAWETVPQNSLLAVYESIMLGIDGAEIDLRLSKDGVVVLCHDDHIRSCTTVSKDATDEEALVKNLNWADLKTKAVVGPYATGSQDLDYPITEAQASILNSLPEYLNHYGAAAKAGDKLTMARLDDVLDLVEQYGPNTLLTLDKMDSAEIFAASYKLVRDKGMLDRVIFKCSREKSTFDSWITAAANACGIAENTVKTSMHMMYVVGASTANNLTEVMNHANNGGYLQSVEITYGADSAASAEAGIRSTLKPYCQTNGIALYGSSIGEAYCGGKNDAEGTWAHLLALGYDGIMTDAPTELAAYMNAYNTQKAASQTIQAEHFQSCNNETMHFRLQQNRDSNGNKLVRGMQNGDYLVYENVSFTGTESKLYFRTQGLQHGAILRFYLDEVSSGNCLAAYTLGMDAEPYTLSTSLRIGIPAGVHRVIVQVSGVEDVDLLNFDSFSFAPENHYLFFDFANTAADQERYTAPAYGGKNFDLIDNWIQKDLLGAELHSGALHFHTYQHDHAFIQTGSTSFATANQPLHYTPGPNDHCIIRLRIDNASLVAGKTAQLNILFGTKAARPDSTQMETYDLDFQKVNNQGYFELSFPMTNAKYLSAGDIASIRIYVANITGEGENGADIAVDYLYLGPVRPTESLYFGFGNSEADELRYKDPVYGGYNYDKAGEGGYWATHSTAVDTTDPAADRERNQKNYTIDNSSGTFTLQVGDSTEGETKHGPKFMTSNQYGVYPWTGRGQYAPLRFNPASAEVIVVRFKLTNCSQASGEALELQVDMHFQDSNGTLYNRYNVTNVPYSATNGVYQTVTIPLSGFATRVPLLTSLGLRFVGIKKPSATDVGTVTIDYLYMGPRSESPAEQALYFDFSHSVSDQQRYNSPVYGYLDYDLEGEGYWATYTTQYEEGADNSMNQRNYVMDNSAGTVTVVVGDGLEGDTSAYGPKVMTTNTYGVFPYRGRAENAPLHFDPSNAKYLEVRFRLDNVKKQADLTMQMEYHYHKTDGNDNIAYENTKIPYELRLGEYQTIQIPLSSTFKNAQEVTSLGLRFLGICSEDSQELGRVTIDYIYVGREESLPSKARPVYGWDSSYIDDSKLSNGSSYFVHGQGVKLNDTTENYTQFSFDFVGTGFDLISRTGAKQATIRVNVYKAEDRSKAIKALTVNNKGELELYQIPVVSIQGLEYGAYYVTVGVNKAVESAYDFLSRGGEFHLDALRIYDPIPSSTVTDPEAFETYRKDLEAYPHIKEIRNILLSAEDYAAQINAGTGAIFVDSEKTPTATVPATDESGDPIPSSTTTITPEGITVSGHLTASVTTYDKIGPKNEVYLAPGQAVAFKLQISTTHIPTSVDVGVKTIQGNEFSTLVAGIVTKENTTAAKLLTVDARRDITVNSATAQYYALPIDTESFSLSEDEKSRYCYIVLYNNGSTGSITNVLSLTDIKVAYDAMPELGLPQDAVTDTEIQKRSSNVEEPYFDFLVDGQTLEAAALVMRAVLETPILAEGGKLMHSLNLASDISINYVVSKAALADYQSFYLEVRIFGQEEALRIEPVEKDGYQYFTLEGLTAVQMNDEITATLYMEKDGRSYYWEADHYSIAQYAYAQLNKEGANSKLKTLCADLLRYGARAQIFKGYRTDSLADANMTDAHRAYLSDMDSVTFGNTNKVLNDLENAPISWAGKALNLESKVAVKYIFSTANYTGDLKDLSLRVTYTDLSGKTVTATVTEPEAYKPENSQYAFSFDGLLAAELRTVLSAQVYAGDSPVSVTLQYSPDTYGNNKEGTLGTLCRALFAYSDSAKAYFVGK